MKKTEKKEDGEGLGRGKEGEEERGAGGGDKKEEGCRSVQTSAHSNYEPGDDVQEAKGRS